MSRELPKELHGAIGSFHNDRYPADEPYDTIVGRDPESYLVGLLDQREKHMVNGDPRTKPYGHAIADLLGNHPGAADNLPAYERAGVISFLHDHVITVAVEATEQYLRQIHDGVSEPLALEANPDYTQALRAYTNVHNGHGYRGFSESQD